MTTCARVSWAALFALALAGCYTDRWTQRYDDIAEIGSETENSAVLEESGQDAASLAERQRRLEALATEDEPAYRLNAGDMIAIRVYGHEDLSLTTRIGPDGTIGLPFIGQTQLSGLTIGEGAEKIRVGIEPYVKNPVVSITLNEVRSETATIAGACAHPGVYGISHATRLADLYAMAGSSAKRLYNGSEIDIANLDNSVLIRENEILPVEIRRAVEHGDMLHNIRVRRGDYVYIAHSAELAVTVCGEVKSPCRRVFVPGMGLLETLTEAGWMLESHWSHVIIIRNGLADPKMYKVDIDGILAGRCKNIALKAGDIIYVPKDNLAEYNVFVRKLMPTAQLYNLLASRISAISSN